MDIFDLKQYWLSLNLEDREGFAKEAGTTRHYVQTHLIGRRKIPGKLLMDRIFKALKRRGALDKKESLLAFFYAK